jgi:hypothetical protein
MKQTLIVVLMLSSFSAFAANKHLGTPEQQRQAVEWNKGFMMPMSKTSGNWTAVRPFSEIETTGYVAIAGDDDFEMPDLRLAIAQNLPANASLIVYISIQSDANSIKAKLGQYLGDRLKFLVVPESRNSDPIWARDSLPFPVYTSASTMGMVDSIYPQSFEPDAAVDQALGNVPMVSTHQYFRGGNLLYDLDGNCFSEDVNETAGLQDPQQFFTQYFGCKTVTLLKQEGGIGDIDERIKFLSGKVALTDDQTYAKLLTSKGYQVSMIPSTGADDETYMNTLVVNGTIFVPQMGIAADADAVAAYNKLGFKAVGVYTKELAVEGDGNIHCVTMNYPPGTFAASVRGSDFVEFK